MGKKNRARLVVNDNDYVPPIGDDDNDNESSNLYWLWIYPFLY